MCLINTPICRIKQWICRVHGHRDQGIVEPMIYVKVLSIKLLCTRFFEVKLDVLKFHALTVRRVRDITTGQDRPEYGHADETDFGYLEEER